MDSLNHTPLARTNASIIKYSKDKAVLWGGIENNLQLSDPDHRRNPQLDLKYGSWSYLHETFPPSTFNHTIQRAGKKTVVFGGKNKKNIYSQKIWLYNKGWQAINSKAEGRIYASSCSNRNQVTFFGGQNSKGKKLNNGFTFDLITKKIRYFTLSIPGLRSHSFNCYKQKWIIIGGRIQKGFNTNTYVVHSQNHKVIKTFNHQTPRLGHSTHINKGYLYLLGGREKGGKIHNDFSKLNLENYRWTKLPSPQFTPQTNMATAQYRGHWFLVHGRSLPATGHDEIIVFNFDRQRWLPKPTKSCISPRFNIASFQDHHLLYLVNGFGSNIFLKDGCMLDLRQFIQNQKPSS